jgi:hypothetical protein
VKLQVLELKPKKEVMEGNFNSWQLAQKRTVGNSQLITPGPKENCGSQLLASGAGTVIPNF